MSGTIEERFDQEKEHISHLISRQMFPHYVALNNVARGISSSYWFKFIVYDILHAVHPKQVERVLFECQGSRYRDGH